MEIETEGLEIYTIGSSAGGYAAVLFGYWLKAIAVFCSCAQMDLSIHDLNREPLADYFVNKVHADVPVSLNEIISNSCHT